MKTKDKIVVIVGQTASGKSDLAVELALAFNGEVISADSRQVYKGLDIASGKITRAEMCGVPHHLLDVANPKTEVFTVSDFVILADKAIHNIVARGKVPIIAGGTMFYIDALLRKSNIPKVPPNETLRKELEQKDTNTLFNLLAKKDKERARVIDKENKRRLIRALEIVAEVGTIPKETKATSPYDALQIGIHVPREELVKRIHARTTHRAIRGMLDEARTLHKNGLSFEKMENLGLEYRNLAYFLQGKLTEDKLLEQIEINDRQYARRQMKWWKRDKDIKWFEYDALESVQDAVKDFLE